MNLNILIDRPLARPGHPDAPAAGQPLRGTVLLAREAANGGLVLEIGLHPQLGFVLIARLWQQGQDVRYELSAEHFLGERLPEAPTNFSSDKLAWTESHLADLCLQHEQTYARVLAFLRLNESDL